MRSKKDLMIEFSIDMRTVRKRCETAFINPEQSEISDDEYLRFFRACELLAERKTHAEASEIIAKEFDIEIEQKKSSDTSGPESCPELMATDGAIQLGQQTARLIAQQAMAVTAQLLPIALEEELMNPKSQISQTISNIAYRISSAQINMDAITTQAINARRERLLLAGDEIHIESEQLLLNGN